MYSTYSFYIMPFALIFKHFAKSMNSNIFQKVENLLVRSNIKRMLLFISGVLIFISCLSCKKNENYKEGSTKSFVDSLIVVAQDSIYNNASFTRSTAEKALKLAKDSFEYYKVLHIIDYYYLNEGLYDSLYINIHRILNYLKKVDRTEESTSLLLKEFNALAVLYAQTGALDSALHYNHKAFDILKTISDKSDLPNVCINTADSYMKLGDYANSAKFFRMALYYCDSMKIADQMGFPVYFGLAQVYMGLKAYDLSNEYFDLAERTFNERSVDERFLFCNNRGNLYYYFEDYRKALSLFQRAKKQLPANGFEFAENLANINLSDVYLHLNIADSASYFAERCLPFFERINHVSALYYLNTIRAGIAMLEHNPSLANEILVKERIDPEIIEVNMKLIRMQFLQDYYAEIGDFKNAYKSLKEESKLSDSIRSENISNRVGELDMRYKQDTALLRKDLLIEAQKGKVEKLVMTKIIWIIASSIAIIVTILVYLFLKRQNRLMFNLHIEQTARLRMQNIRNRISPHFVFNVINHQISPDGNTGKNKQLMELARLLRASLELSENISITLDQELEFIKAYVLLEGEKYRDSLSVTYDIDNQIDTSTLIIPSMIIQIQVENAIKHGFNGIEGQKNMIISVKNREKGVFIQVIDNGNGYKPGVINSNGTGTGLKTVLQTISLLNGKNIDKIEFSISNRELQGQKGTIASVFIPSYYNYKI